MFDILGYRDLFEHNKLDDLIEIYYDNILNRDVPALAFGNSHTSDLSPSVEAEKLAFSDTFILYQNIYDNNSQIEKLQRIFAFLVYSAYLLRFSFHAGIPLRGALSFGEYYVDTKNISFLGKPIVEAYDASNKQNWCGAVVCNSAMDVIKDVLTNQDVKNYIGQRQAFCRSKDCDKLCDKDIDELIIEYNIPYRDSCKEKCYYLKGNALRWDDFACRDIAGIVLDNINIDNKVGDINSHQAICREIYFAFSAHKKNTSKKDVKQKIKETSNFFEYINNSYSKQFTIKKSIISFRPNKIL